MTDKALFSPGAVVAPVIDWLNTNAHGFFRAISITVETSSRFIEGAPLTPPAPVMAAAVVAQVLWRQGPRMALLATGCLAVSGLSGLWVATMQTVALVSISVMIAVAIAFPPGILAARRPRLEAVLRPILDLMQTVPPWVYLIPAVMFFSLGKVPAMLATAIYGIPPMLRIATLAFKQVPRELVELGPASGTSPFQTLLKIEGPSCTQDPSPRSEPEHPAVFGHGGSGGAGGRGWIGGRSHPGADPDGNGPRSAIRPCDRCRRDLP